MLAEGKGNTARVIAIKALLTALWTISTRSVRWHSQISQGVLFQTAHCQRLFDLSNGRKKPRSLSYKDANPFVMHLPPDAFTLGLRIPTSTLGFSH